MNFSEAERQFQTLIEHTAVDQVVEKTVEFLHSSFKHYNWVGIYLVQGNNLILGPWRGPQATEHISIPIGTGVCGSAALTGKTEIVDDVTKDIRYLSCFISTKSEIVVPIKKEGKVIGEIDIDSDTSEGFNTNDAEFLKKVAEALGKFL